jgi:hypothetical protein
MVPPPGYRLDEVLVGDGAYLFGHPLLFDKEMVFLSPSIFIVDIDVIRGMVTDGKGGE